MDDSPVKGLTLSSPMSFNNIGGNNENDESGSPTLVKLKKVVWKHFMSPTISAATKAAALVPRKKILADRNEGFTFTNSPKPLVGSARIIQSNCSSDNDCDDDQNIFDGDSMLKKKPYDPLTNYLSPRPKFLRYNPNKKRRIFLCGENEIGKMKDGLGFVSTSSSFESQKVVEEKKIEGGVKKEDEELETTKGNRNGYDDEDVEEAEESEFEEEEKEKKCWRLLGLLKFLLVLGSLFLSISFIYTMNSPDSLLIQEAVWDYRGGFVNQSNIHEKVFSRKEYVISEFEVMNGKGEESHLSLLHVVAQKDMVDNEFAESGISEDDGNGNELLDSTAGFPEVTIETSENIYNDGLMRKVEASNTLQWAEPNESEGDTDIEVVHSETKALDSSANECRRDQEMESTEAAGISEDNGNGNGLLDSTAGLPELTIEKSKDVYNDGLMREVEPSDTLQWAEPKESEGNSDIEVVHSEAEALDSRANECTRDQEMESTEEAFDQVQGAETVEVSGSVQKDLFPEIEPITDVNAESVMMESMEIKLQLEVLVLTVNLSTVAALGFLYWSRQRNIGKKMSFPTQKNNGKENSMPVETQHQNAEPVKAAHRIHNNSSAICSVKEETMKKVESIVSPSKTPFPPTKVVTEEFSRQSQAPVVELLGELVIGEEANGFFKSTKRRRVLDSEVKNGSNYLFTQTVMSQSNAPFVRNQRYSPQLELSYTAGSSSQKKKSVSKKEENKAREVSMTNVTPVRRSTRIRNKAMSPC